MKTILRLFTVNLIFIVGIVSNTSFTPHSRPKKAIIRIIKPKQKYEGLPPWKKYTKKEIINNKSKKINYEAY